MVFLMPRRLKDGVPSVSISISISRLRLQARVLLTCADWIRGTKLGRQCLGGSNEDPVDPIRPDLTEISDWLWMELGNILGSGRPKIKSGFNLGWVWIGLRSALFEKERGDGRFVTCKIQIGKVCTKI